MLRNIINPIKLIDELCNLDKSYHGDAKALSSIFLNYEIPIVQIKNRTKEEAGVIFERINNTGTKLNTLDLMTAWTWTEEFHLLDAIDRLISDLELKSFGSIEPKLMLQVVSGIIIGSTKTENVLRLTGERVRDNWQKVENSVKAAVDFLSTQVKCSNIEFLPFHQQIITLSRFYSKTSKISSDQLVVLKKYFWRSSFSDRYSTGQTTTKIDADIEFVDKIINYDFSDIKKYNVSVTLSELIDTQFSRANPMTRAFLLLCAQYEPLNLTNGGIIDIGRALVSFNRKEYHHIFPDSFLKKAGISKNKRYSLLNFCFLPSESNKKISTISPSNYFYKIIPSDKKQEILSSNLLPTSDEIYKNDDFESFLNARGKIIINSIDKITS